MSADDVLKELYKKRTQRGIFDATLNLVTNIMTPEGRKLSCTWIHTTKFRDPFEGGISNGHEDITCTVQGDNLEEVIRKVALMEDEFSQSGK